MAHRMCQAHSMSFLPGSGAIISLSGTCHITAPCPMVNDIGQLLFHKLNPLYDMSALLAHHCAPSSSHCTVCFTQASTQQINSCAAAIPYAVPLLWVVPVHVQMQLSDRCLPIVACHQNGLSNMSVWLHSLGSGQDSHKGL